MGATSTQHGGDKVNEWTAREIIEGHRLKAVKITPTELTNAHEFLKELNESRISSIVSPDASITTNEAGGSQSYVPVRFDLIDGKALFAMASVLHEGAVKYGDNNWRKIKIEDHLNHLIMHAYAYLSGDRTDAHLSHIMCRAMFSQAVELE